jgi:hypothetical protein
VSGRKSTKRFSERYDEIESFTFSTKGSTRSCGLKVMVNSVVFWGPTLTLVSGVIVMKSMPRFGTLVSTGALNTRINRRRTMTEETYVSCFFLDFFPLLFLLPLLLFLLLFFERLLLFLLLFLDRLLPFFVPLLPFFVPLLLFLLPFPLFLPDFFFFFFEDLELLLDLLFFPFFFRFLLPLLPFFFFFLSLGLKNISIFRSYSQLQFYTRFWFFFGNFETLFRRFLRRSLGQSLPKVEQNVDSAFALVQDTDRFDSRFAHHDRPQIDEFVSLVHKCQFEGHSFAQNVHVRFFTIHVEWKLQIVLSYDERVEINRDVLVAVGTHFARLKICRHVAFMFTLLDSAIYSQLLWHSFKD